MFVISEGCVGCHYCKLECPAQAIGIKDGRYQINQDKCIGCGKCVDLCHLNLISDTEKKAEIVPHETIKLDCDVLVIGAGGVGTAAAARSAQLGYDVILLEAAKHFGGGTYLAHGAVFPGSKVIEEKYGVDSGFERSVNMWVMNQTGESKTPIETLRSNVAGHGEFFDWFATLDEKYLEPFQSCANGPFVGVDMKDRYLNTKSTDDSIGPGWMGSWITEKLFESTQKFGVRYFNETRAREFITDGEGKIIGVRATDAGGDLEITAKVFVLGTGGYIMNDERVNAVDKDLVRGKASYLRLNVPTNVGDGHDMLAAVGGDIDYGRAGARGPTHHPYSYGVNKLLNMPEMFYVTDEGERKFELSTLRMGPPAPKNIADNPITEMILHSKTGKCWIIMDEELLVTCASRLGPTDAGHEVDWLAEIKAEAELDDVPAKMADSIAILAEKMEVKPETLTATIERWNELCAEGSDADFGKASEHMRPIKTAPFYAFMCHNFDNGASRGGVSIDGMFRPLKKDGGIIEGVYCAGDAATYSWSEDIGPVGLCGGLGGSWASGFRIAAYADAYIKEKK